VKTELEESDIIAREVDLVCRSIDEYMVLLKLREMRLKETKDRAAKLIDGGGSSLVDKCSVH